MNGIIGLDYRPASVAPCSGIGRQVRALEQALAAHAPGRLVRFSEAPLAHPDRDELCCPPWPSPLNGLQRPPVRWRFEARFLPRALDEQRVGLYIATANMGLPIARKTPDRRYVLLLHDLFQLTERNHHRSRLKALAYRGIDTLSIAWSVRVADRVWCPSRFSADEARRVFPWIGDKLRVLPNLVPAPPHDAAIAPVELPSRFWLAVGTREPRKNMALFVDCWRALRARSSLIPALVLIGDPLDLPAPLQRLPGLHWRKDASDAQLHGLYQAAECLWQPSFAEGFGLPVVEALYHGTPVAVAKGSALDEVTPPDSPRFSPRDRDQLAECMLQLGRAPQQRDQPAQLEWARRFGTPAYQARVDSLLRELTG